MKAAVLAAGLDPLPVEGSVLHIHAHLDVYYQGKPVVVPRGLGIGPGDSFFSELHTHDSSGVVHVESPVRKNFTLGEFFKEWGVSLDGAMVYFDGKAPGIAPADVVLEDHDEIVVVFGPPPARIFTGFDWTTYWAGGPPVAM